MKRKWNRRAFLRTSAVSIAALGLSGPTSLICAGSPESSQSPLPPKTNEEIRARFLAYCGEEKYHRFHMNLRYDLWFKDWQQSLWSAFLRDENVSSEDSIEEVERIFRNSNPLNFGAWWRGCTEEAMTLIDVLPEGKLYYYDQRYHSTWTLVDSDLMVASLENGESYDEICDRVRVWRKSVASGRGLRLGHNGGSPFLWAQPDPREPGGVTWVCHPLCLRRFRPRHLPPAQRRCLLPHRWPRYHLARIEKLLRDREPPQSQNSPDATPRRAKRPTP